MELNSTDPKLTQYALGELNLKEHEIVKKVVEADPELKRAVDEIRMRTELLGEEFPTESLPNPHVESETIEAKASWWMRWSKAVYIAVLVAVVAAMIFLIVLPRLYNFMESLPLNMDEGGQQGVAPTEFVPLSPALMNKRSSRRVISRVKGALGPVTDRFNVRFSHSESKSARHA